MAGYTAYFRVQMTGDAEVLSKFRQLEEEKRRLERSRIQIKIDATQTNNEILRLDQHIKELQARIKERVNMKADTTVLRAELRQAQADLLRLRAAADEFKIDDNNAVEALNRVKMEMNDIIAQAQKDTEMNIGTSNAESGLSRLQSHLQGIGDLLTGVGGKLQDLGGMFGGNLLDMVGRRLVTMGTRSLVSGMERSVSRYDIMKTFPQYAEAVGTDSERAAEMVQELNEAVLGLPTGLDEIVDSAKQYGILLNDLERGKDLAISMNNALLASGASESMQTQAEYEVFRLLTSGTLSTKRQWRTLFQGLGAARQYIAKEMGFSDVTQWQNELMGEMPSDATKEEKAAIKAHAAELQSQFIDALVKAGQGEGILSLVEIYKSTLESALANVKNAFANLGANILEGVSDVLLEETGLDLVDTIVSFSDTIKQSLIPAVRDWIRENPDAITDFLDKIKNYDWGTLLENIATFASTYFNVMSSLLTAIPPEATAFLMTLASPVGKGLSALGGFFQMLASIKIGTGGGSFLSRLGSAGGAAEMANVGASLGSFMSGLAKVGGVVILTAGIGGVIYEFAKIAEAIGNMEIGDNFMDNIAKVNKLLAPVTILAGVVTALVSVLPPQAQMAALLGEGVLGGFLAIVAGIGGIIGEFASVAEQISTMRIASDFGKRCEKIATGIGGLALVVGALSGAAGTFAVPILIGEGVLKSMGKTLKDLLAMAEDLQELADLHMSDAKIKQASSKGKRLIESIADLFMQMKESFDSPTMMGLWFDTGSSKSMQTIVSNMNDVVTNLHEVADTFLGMEDALNKLEETSVIGPDGRVHPDRLGRITNGITEVIASIGTIFTNIKTELAKQKYPAGYTGYIDPESWFELWFDKSSSTSMISIITNMVSVVEQIDSFVGTVSGMETKLQSLTAHTGSGTRGGSSSMERITRYMGEVVAGIGEMYQGLYDAFNPNGTYGTLGFTSMNAGFVGDIMKSLNLVIGSTQNLVEKFPKLEEALTSVQSLRITESAFTQQRGGEVVTRSQSDKKSVMATVTEQLGVFAQDMYDMFQALSMLEQFQQSAMNLSDMTTDLSSSMTNLFDSITTINENKDLLDQLVKDDTFALGDKLNVIMGSLATAFGSLDYGEDAFAGMSMAGAAEAIQQSMGYISQVITTLSEQKDVINSMFNENDMFDMGNKLGKITTSLRRAFDSLTSGDFDFANLPDQVTDISNAVANMKGVFDSLKMLEETINGFYAEGSFTLGTRLNEVFTSLNGIFTGTAGAQTALPIAGFQGFGGQIDALNTSFQNLSTQGVEQATSSLQKFNGALNAVKSSVNNFRASLQLLLTQYSITAAGAGVIASSMSRIAASINVAANAARNLANAINAIPTTKSISVNYNGSGVISRMRSLLPHTGGMIANGRIQYRAGGGSIFRPKGTDTVPAMLTPGEYVMRRAAVKLFGGQFFQNLNNMNLAGALSALYTRAGSYVLPKSGGVTNNYNRDNHAQVTQHIHTNNTNYALKRANRWVNAL